MASLAENLKPPFFAAILNEHMQPKSFDDEITPSDEMVSIAPSQPGFLGLETTRDENGKGIIVSYWTDLRSEKAWEHRGDNEIRNQFGGKTLEQTCAIRISKIEHQIGSEKPLKAGPRAIPESTMVASIGALLLSAFPAVSELLGHQAVR